MEKFTSPVDNKIIALCETVFDLAFELGFDIGKRGIDSIDADSRDLARIVINEAIQFENQFDESKEDYMLKIGDQCDSLINYIYGIFGKEDTNP